MLVWRRVMNRILKRQSRGKKQHKKDQKQKERKNLETWGASSTKTGQPWGWVKDPTGWVYRILRPGEKQDPTWGGTRTYSNETSTQAVGTYDPKTGKTTYSFADKGTVKPYKQCHDSGPQYAFSWKSPKGEVIVFCGIAHECNMLAMDAVVDLGGSGSIDTLESPSNGFRRAKALMPKPPAYIHIPTADARAPSVTKDFWTALLEDLEEAAPLDVLICCVGGHGRTGIGASIIAALSGAVPEGESPIEFIRRKYCNEAVETQTQIDYINKVLGAKYADKPSGFSTYDPSGGYYGSSTGKYYPATGSGYAAVDSAIDNVRQREEQAKEARIKAEIQREHEEIARLVDEKLDEHQQMRDLVERDEDERRS